jgi:hypothetical protein
MFFGPFEGTEELIDSRVEELKNLLQKDQQCLDFLRLGKNYDPIQFLNDALKFDTIGVAAIAPSVTVSPGGKQAELEIVGAETGSGRVKDKAIVINSLGAFFNSTYTSEGFTFNLTQDQGKFTGGTRSAQLFMLLHELGHATGVLPHDNRDAELSKKNDKLIDKNCRDTIKELEKMK